MSALTKAITRDDIPPGSWIQNAGGTAAANDQSFTPVLSGDEVVALPSGQRTRVKVSAWGGLLRAWLLRLKYDGDVVARFTGG